MEQVLQKNKFPLLFNGKVVLKYGNTCCKIERLLNRICGGNQGKIHLAFGLIIGLILDHYMFNLLMFSDVIL